MKARSKKAIELFDIQDDKQEKVKTVWEIEQGPWSYDPETDEVTVQVICKEQGSQFMHVRTFSKSARGTDFKKSQVTEFFRQQFKAKNWEVVPD